MLPASPWLRAAGVRSLLRRSVRRLRCCPIGAFVFSRVTFAGLIVNFAAIPLMTVVQIAGMAAVALHVVAPDVARWAGWIAHMAVEGLIGSAALVDIMPWLTRRLAPPSLWVIAVYYAALHWRARRPTFARLRVRSRSSRAALWIVAAPVALSGEPMQPAARDVSRCRPGRRGDRAVPGRPHAQHRRWRASLDDVRYRTARRFAGVLGARRPAARLHEHHSRRRRPHRRRRERVPRFRAVRSLGRRAGAAAQADAASCERSPTAAAPHGERCSRRDRVSFGSVELVVHHPPLPEWERQRVRNDDSEVIEIRYGGVSFVFTGDIGREVERDDRPVASSARRSGY